MNELYRKAPAVQVIEAMRRTLLTLAQRISHKISLEESVFVVEGLWGFTCVELFGRSPAWLKALYSYTNDDVEGTYKVIYSRHRDCWSSPDGFFISGVLCMLNYVKATAYNPETEARAVRMNISQMNFLREFLSSNIAADAQDVQSEAWLNSVFDDHFQQIQREKFDIRFPWI